MSRSPCPRGRAAADTHRASFRAVSISPVRMTASRFLSRLRSGQPAGFGATVEALLPGPIRGELLGAEQLAERVAAVARGQRVTTVRRRRARLLARLTETRRILEEAHARLVAVAAREVDVGPAGDWLLDNFHVVREHILEVHESLPRGYYHELPELASGPLAGYPRIYELTITLVSHTEARVDEENIDLVLSAFQRVAPLSMGELWAVPAMLRLGLIESVRRVALRTVQRLDEIETADGWAGRLQAASDRGKRALGTALNDFIADPPPLSPYFVSRFLQQLRRARGDFPPLVWLEQWIGEDGPSAEEADAWSAQRQATTQIIMANSITSLRAIARMDWRAIVERHSVVEAVLRQDPSAFYARMTFATRDHYRHVVERMAKRTRRDELSVVHTALDLARSGDGNGKGDARRAHIGYYLVDDGLADLERAVGYRSPLRERAHRWVLHHPYIVFGGGILLATWALLWVALRSAAPASLGATIAALLLAFIPANDVAINIVNQLVTTFLPPRMLPKLDLSQDGSGGEGIPAELRTAVVIPTLFQSVDVVREALSTLEVQFLANREGHVHFALLSDFADAPTETCPDDAAIIDAAVAGINDLNTRYGAAGANERFHLFHRPRRWNAQEGVWMGWERKRGKLAQFNRFVQGRAGDAFSLVVGDSDADSARAIRHHARLGHRAPAGKRRAPRRHDWRIR